MIPKIRAYNREKKIIKITRRKRKPTITQTVQKRIKIKRMTLEPITGKTVKSLESNENKMGITTKLLEKVLMDDGMGRLATIRTWKNSNRRGTNEDCEGETRNKKKGKG